MKRRLVNIAIGCVLGLAVAFVAAWQIARVSVGPAGETASVQGTASIGGPFELVDHTGRTVTERDYEGRYKLVYFGFTYCPDVCPTELEVMSRAIDALGPDGERVQPLLVTIDPARDTPEQLAQYVGLFHPRLVGLTGTPEQIAAAARAYKVYYARSPGSDDDAYTMDHSSFVYLMGPDGAFLDVYPHGTDAERMAAGIGAHMASGRAS